MEGIGPAVEYYKEGGRNRETWNRLCDGLGHEAPNLMMALSAPAHPFIAADAENAVAEAAGITARLGGMREALQQQVAKGLLMSVLTVGQQNLVEPADWPDELAVVVLGAVRRAEKVSQDPMMANLRDKGFPA
ncbi:hypothetical protein [Frankia sp. Cas4]|uniref:hypothetical protein n=1 Tax=Frankia sp. Cas4 TaxID=3073927 RepID=UPI002AD247D8|nr:hypothetical protein [Frankia sp. Cas4]